MQQHPFCVFTNGKHPKSIFDTANCSAHRTILIVDLQVLDTALLKLVDLPGRICGEIGSFRISLPKPRRCFRHAMPSALAALRKDEGLAIAAYLASIAIIGVRNNETLDIESLLVISMRPRHRQCNAH